ncbi:CDC27 family protein [Flavobacterium enshiense]|uniref:CDC27 family protein n=1 Tax=Flavobacterium enshiense TaxID=1341165 RepID=UPI00345DFAC6
MALLTGFKKDSGDCDYTKTYYQLIYQAEIHYLNDEFSEAYNLIKEAEKNCKLLNQTAIGEPRMMAECCMKLGKKKEAILYLQLYLDYGMKMNYIENNSSFETLKKEPQWKDLITYSIKANNEFEKNVNKELRAEIIKICNKDQAVRQKPVNWQIVKRTDSLHEVRIKEIFKEYGFPNPTLIGNHVFEERTEITALLMHFEDTTYFKPVLKDFIRKGQAPPSLLANMIDSRLRFAGLYSYGAYENVDSTQIKDFHKIDERRIAIGMSPYKMHKKKMDLLRKKYPILNAN